MNATEIKVETIDGQKTIYMIDSDSWGKPRYVVHYQSLGFERYGFGEYRKFGLKKYRAKWFGGGYAFSGTFNDSDFTELFNEIIENNKK